MAWAEARDVLEPAHWFLHLLRVRTKRHWDFIATAFDGLAACEPYLQRWHRRGAPVAPLTRLVSAWSGERPQPFRYTRATSHPPTQEFSDKGTADSDYFYLLFQCQRPTAEDADPQLGLRTWVLLKGLELANLGNVSDALLRQVCTSLRLAAYEKRRDWAEFFAPLAGFTSNPYLLEARLQEAALAATIALGLGSDEIEPKHQNTLDALRKLASGGDGKDDSPGPLGDPGWPAPSVLKPGPSSATAPPSDTDEEDSDDAPITLDWTGLDEPDAVIIAVRQDPDASPAEQEEATRTIHLLRNADARFLAWDWNRPTPDERAALGRQIEQTLTSSAPRTPTDHLTASLAVLALTTGQSLPEVLRLPLTEGTASNSIWRIDLARGQLIQRAPRREGHWRPSDRNADAVRADIHELPWSLPDRVVETLAKASAAAPGASDVGALWPEEAGSCLTTFNRWVQSFPSTARLTHGSLAMTLGTGVYLSSGDPVLARLASARSFAGMPAATAYTAYTADAVAQHTPLPLATGTSSLNAAGSLLDTEGDGHLQARFADLGARLEQAAGGGDFVAWHNLLALYWDARLRAVTGARPIGRMWTSAEDFDWDRGFCFIDDKRSPLSATGRLAPVPYELLQEFRATYVEAHLRALRCWYGAQIENSGEASLLFMLERKGDALYASAITHAHREKLGLEDPLPTNLMRHRLRTWLHRHNADPEVVDSLLGHSDGATLTHGAYSMRTWLADAAAIRPLLAQASSELTIAPAPVWHEQAPEGRPPAVGTATPFPVDALTSGHHTAIAIDRKWRREAIAIIHQHVREKLGDAYRPPRGAHALLDQLALLSEQHMDELAQRLCRTDKGLPAQAGITRFDVLRRLSDHSWRHRQQPLNLTHRYRLEAAESSPFTPLTPLAGTLLQRLASVLDEAFVSAKHLSKVSIKSATLLVLVDVAVTTGATHPKLLQAIAGAREQLRLVTWADAPYLEWAPHTSFTERPEAAVQRFRISRRAAVLFDRLASVKTATQHDDPSLPLRLRVCEALGLDQATPFDRWLKAVCAVVQQDNAITLPGTVAAFLDGRVMTASLDPSDWVRLRCAHKAAAPWQLLSAPGRMTLHEGSMSFGNVGEEVADPRAVLDLRRRTAQEFLVLARAGAAQLHGLNTQGRRDAKVDELEADIEGFARNAGGRLSGTVRMLGLWLVHLLRQKRTTGYARIRAVSAVRYFDALAPQFRELAHDVDLAEMEGDEIGDLYRKMIQTSRVTDKHYQFERLRNFHVYVQVAFAVDECDWSSVAPGEASLLGAPGLIDDALYSDVLALSSCHKPPPGVATWQCTAFLVLARRFGLRGREVLGLNHSDLQGWPHAPVVCVRGRHGSRIKSPAAKRVVPLMFQLLAHERDAIDRLVAHHTAASIGIDDPPLLGDISDPSRRLDIQVVRPHLNTLLRAAAGRKGLSVHDLRHSFANCLWAAVEGFEHVPPWFWDGLAVDHHLMRSTLLGRTVTTASRRGAWAIARQLGHAHPSTGLRSYVHLVPEVAELGRFRADTLEPPWATRSLNPSMRLEDLDRVWPQPTDVLQSYETLTPRLALEAMKLLPLRGPRATEAIMNLRAGTLDLLSALTAGVEARLTAAEPPDAAPRSTESTSVEPTAMRTKARAPHARAAARGLLASIRRSAFVRLRTNLMNHGGRLLAAAQATSAPSIEESIAMVGPAGDLSAWKPEQVRLISALLECAVADQKRVTLRSLAAHVPWAHETARSLPWQLKVRAALQLPAVELPSSGAVLRRRLVISLDDGATGFAFNRSEFIVALVCVISCAPCVPEGLASRISA